MMPGTKISLWLFYTYDANGEDTVVEIKAPSRAAAVQEFDQNYGTDCPVDIIVRQAID